MPIVTSAALDTELKRLGSCIEHISQEDTGERRSSYDKAVATIYVLNRLGLVDTERARLLHTCAEASAGRDALAAMLNTA